MRLVHELEQLVHDRFEELPMRLEEPRVLTDDIHDVGCDDGLVVFSALDFAQSKKVLNDGDQETLLCLFVCITCQ